MAEINNPLQNNFYNSVEVEEKLAKVKDETKRDNEKLSNIMAGVVIFIAVTFLIEICTMNMDRIKDKDMYLQYTQMYKDYFDESSKMKEIINEEKINVNNLENNINLIKIKNPYLK